MRRFSVTTLLIISSILSACGDKQEHSKDKADVVHSEYSGTQASTAEILVTVDGSTVTAPELEYAVSRLTAGQLIPSKQALNEKVLQSLVASRAMAILQERTLTEDAKQQLALKVAAYREELLVKDYINTHASPQPVTNEQVKAYYQKNPNEFGGDNLKTFEYIVGVNVEDDDDKKTLQQALSSLTFASDWQAKAEALKKQGLSVEYKTAKMRESLVQEPVKSLLEKTDAGAMTPVLMAEEVLVLKVTSHQKISAKPFAQVSSEIRKTLAAIETKESIRTLTDDVLNRVEINYPKEE